MNLPVLLHLVLASTTALSNGHTSLADSLFNGRFYTAAATEYKRALFLGSENPGLDHLKLGLSLGAAGRTEAAAEALRNTAEHHRSLSYQAGLALAGLFAMNNKTDRARLELLDLLIFTRDSVRRVELNSSIGWLELTDNNLSEAATSYEKAGRISVAAQVNRAGQLPGRNPTIAMVLSSLIPGTGEIYAGRPVTGLLSLLVTGGSAAGVYYAVRSDDWMTAAVVFSVLFLRFYNGSRRNALSFAEEFNRVRRQQQLTELAIAEQLQPDWFSPAHKLTGLCLPSSWNLTRETAGRPVPKRALHE